MADEVPAVVLDKPADHFVRVLESIQESKAIGCIELELPAVEIDAGRRDLDRHHFANGADTEAPAGLRAQPGIADEGLPDFWLAAVAPVRADRLFFCAGEDQLDEAWLEVVGGHQLSR